MQYLLLFSWHSFFRKIPLFWVRSIIFIYLFRNSIGRRSSLHRSLELYCIGGISIGQSTTINKYVDLDGRGGLYIGNNVSISAYVKIITGSHDIDSKDFKFKSEKIIIEDYVWIVTNALILPGVTLKKGCVVAAGSVVTKDVEKYCVVAGNPAKPIKIRSSLLEYDPYWKPYLQ